MTSFAADRARRTTETDRWLAGMLGAEPGVALVAVGGYGRRELLPGSDLDVLLLHAGRDGIASIADRVWYPVWDSGARLDHAVRTVPQARRVARADLKVALGLLNSRHVAGDPSLTMQLREGALEDWRAAARARPGAPRGGPNGGGRLRAGPRGPARLRIDPGRPAHPARDHRAGFGPAGPGGARRGGPGRRAARRRRAAARAGRIGPDRGPRRRSGLPSGRAGFGPAAAAAQAGTPAAGRRRGRTRRRGRPGPRGPPPPPPRAAAPGGGGRRAGGPPP